MLLYVDDSPEVLRILRRYAREFCGETLEVREARCATEALSVIEDARLSGAVIDLRLPEGDTAGIALLARVRQARPTLPAAILTGHLDSDVARQVTALGATALLKPLEDLAPLRAFFMSVLSRFERALHLDAFVEITARKEGLSAREIDIVRARTRGQERRDYIANAGIAASTFDTYVARIKARTGLSVDELALRILREAYIVEFRG